MIIGVSGYGYTGSGAVFDYLKERPDCDYIEEEFVVAYMPHGLQDLEYHLTEKVSRYYSSDAAIKDFLRTIKKMNSPRSAYRSHMGNEFEKKALEFVENVSQVKWSGWWSYDAIMSDFWHQTLRFRLWNRYISYWEKKNKKKHKLPKGDKMYLSIYPDNFEREAKKYVNGLIDGFGCNREKNVVINQPFEGNAPENSMKYFDNAKAIIVDRDPRDVYLFAKEVALNSASFIPTENVRDFIKYYSLCRIKSDVSNSENVLYISFEDMIYDYDSTIKRIDEFLGLPSIKTTRKYFDPDKSINNTQLYLKYTEYDEDIKLIEQGLKEFLYPFEKYQGRVGQGEPFKCEAD